MAKKIKNLTQEQRNRIPEWVDKWTKIGLKTGETDWDTFNENIEVIYKKANIRFPKIIARVDSPIVGAFAASISQHIINELPITKKEHDYNGPLKESVFKTVKEITGKTVDYIPSKLVWHDWLGGQFWVGGWWYGSPSYVSFLTDVCNLELSEDISERASAYRKICESVNYVWLNTEFIIVCARPSNINRNPSGQLHNEHGKSIEYPDGWGLYHLNGVRFLKDTFLKVVGRELDAKDILKFTDIDQRLQAMKFAKNGVRDFYKSEGGKLVDQYCKLDSKGRPINYELWRVPKGNTFTSDVCFAVYDCPSARERGEQREYTKGVPNVDSISQAMAWGMSDEENKLTESEWKEMVPLIHES